jgi:hypothetical protein
MKTEIVFLFFCALIFIIYMFWNKKICYNRRKVENFDIHDWVSEDQSPGDFVRDIAYNVWPNYTWFERYLDKRNDWIRATKGLPPLKPVKPDPKNIKMNLNTLSKTKGSGGYWQSFANRFT